jgi:hypothetical protein
MIASAEEGHRAAHAKLNVFEIEQSKTACFGQAVERLIE